MAQALKIVFFIMPFLFGIGFIAPVTIAIIGLMGASVPFNLPPTAFGLLFGGIWGAYATWKGRWL
ncbi:hypothetical protein [Rhizorhapis sp. SPR117]|uniref:hypothetical protein n=1 Tax=Rhizorhapis sp. SPR117 TaxID=2912611 RepID=UPI001F446610|nr:hypothetical protein [Rhizorhapis sp. SPR117]